MIQKEIKDQNSYIDKVKAAIRAKGPPLKVSQTRLERRSHRPEIENCQVNFAVFFTIFEECVCQCLLLFEIAMFVRIYIDVSIVNVQLSQDTAHVKMVEEVGTIHITIDQLNAKLAQAQEAKAELLSIERNLQNDIGVKSNSLRIDKHKCLGVR